MEAINPNILSDISKEIAKYGDGISYIKNEEDYYIIGTRKYHAKIAQYLDQTVKTWNGKEANLVNLKKRKNKEKQWKKKGMKTPAKKVAYLWKIPLAGNSLL